MSGEVPEYRPSEEREPDPTVPRENPATGAMGDDEVTQVAGELQEPPAAPEAAALLAFDDDHHPEDDLLLHLVYELVEPEEARESLTRHLAACSVCQETMHRVTEIAQRLDQGARARPLDVGVVPFITLEARTRMAGGRAPSTRERGDARVRGRTLSGLLSSLSDAASAPDSRLPGMEAPTASLHTGERDEGAAEAPLADDARDPGAARRSRLENLGSAVPTVAAESQGTGESQAPGERARSVGLRQRPRPLGRWLGATSAAVGLLAAVCIVSGLHLQRTAVSLRADAAIFRECRGPGTYREGDVHRFAVAVVPVGGDRDESEESAAPQAIVTASLADADGKPLGRVTEEIHGSGTLELPAFFTPVRSPVELILESSADGMTSRDVLQLPVDRERPVAHIQFDCGRYLPGDPVRWRALVLDRLTLDDASQPPWLRFHVRDPAGQLVAEGRVALAGGLASREWTVPAGAGGGQYELSVSAPTEEARAVSVDGQLLPAGAPGDDIVLAARTFTVLAPPALALAPAPDQSVPSVELYPEGGDLAVGVPCRLYCEATDARGKRLETDGILVDDRGVVLQRFTTDASGRARIELDPQIGRSYTVEVRAGGGTVARQAVPQPWSGAITLRGMRDTYLDGEPVELAVTGVTSGVAALYCRGVLVGAEELPLSSAATMRTVTITPWRMVSGVLRVTVFVAASPTVGGGAQALRPAAERLVYRQPSHRVQVHVEPLREEVVPGQETAVLVRTTDEEGRPLAARVGLAVFDGDAAGPHVPMAGDILIGAEVESLEGATLWACETAGEERAVDLLLGTQGWRRFVASPTIGSDAAPSHLQVADRTGLAVSRLVAVDGRREGPLHFSNRDSVVQAHAVAAHRRDRYRAGGSWLFRAGGFLLVLGLIFPTLALIALAMRALGHEGSGRARSAIVTVLLLTSPLILAAMPAILSALRGMSSPEEERSIGLSDLPRLEPTGSTGASRATPARLDPATVIAPGGAAGDPTGQLAQAAGPGEPARRSVEGNKSNSGAVYREYRHRIDQDREGPDSSQVVYWCADLRTDSSGEARVQFDTSDLETEWRVVAEAHAPGRLGDGGSSFDARRSFDLVSVEVPGEITAGDTILVPLLVHNRQASPLELRAQLEFLPGESFFAVEPISVVVPGRGTHVIRLAASSVPGLEQVQSVRARVMVSEAGARQVFSADVRVVPRGFRIRSAAGAVLTTTTGVQVDLVAPPDYTPARGVAALDIFATPAASVEAAISGLLARPPLEVEDSVTGVLVASMAMFELPGWQASGAVQWSGQPRDWDIELARNAGALLSAYGERLLELQLGDGSFSRVGQGDGDEWSTAYALLGLAAVLRLGTTVPSAVATGGGLQWTGQAGGRSRVRPSDHLSVRLLERARSGYEAAASWLEELRQARDRAVASGEAPGPNAARRAAPDWAAEDIRSAWILWAISEAGGWLDRLAVTSAVADMQRLAGRSEDALVLSLLSRTAELLGRQGMGASLASQVSALQVRTRDAGRRGLVPSAGATESLEATAAAALAFASQGVTGAYDDALDWLQARMQFDAVLPTGPATMFYLLARCEEARGNPRPTMGLQLALPTQVWGQSGLTMNLSRQSPGRTDAPATGRREPEWSDGGWPPQSAARRQGSARGRGLVLRYDRLDELLAPGINRLGSIELGDRRAPMLARLEHWSQVLPTPGTVPLAVSLRLDQEVVALGGRVALRVDIRARAQGAGGGVVAPRLTIELPTGLRPVAAELEAARVARTFDQYLVRGRELHLFWDRMDAAARGFTVPLEAVHAGQTTGGGSRFTARGESETWLAPLRVTVVAPR